MERKTYQLTDEQVAKLLEAAKPVPCIMVGGMLPTSPQARVNRAWQEVAKEHGFVWDTAQPEGEEALNLISAIPKE